MSRLRILRIISRLNVGGPAVYLKTLDAALRDHHDQWLVCGEEGPGEASMVGDLERSGCRVELVPGLMGHVRPRLSDLTTLFRLRALIRQLRPHVVETHLSRAGVLGRLVAQQARVPNVHVFHGHVFRGHFGRTGSSAARAIEAAMAPLSHTLVAVSTQVRSDLVALNVARPERVVTIEPGLDLSAFVAARRQAGGFRRELGLPSTCPLVGMVGRVVPVKDHPLFVDAAATIASERPDVRFVVVGGGNQEAAVRRHAVARGLDDRFTFVGWRGDMPAVFADIDVLVSCSRAEGMPFSLIEGMASGCVVVATAVGGVVDLVDHGRTGYLVAPHDSRGLATRLLDVLGSLDARRVLTRDARAHVVSRFDVRRFASSMASLYQQVAGSQGRLRATAGR